MTTYELPGAQDALPVCLAGLEPPTCFVIMPFVERNKRYHKGFFDEVYARILEPAARLAGFRPESARRAGTDVIHSTIVRSVLDAPLVLADLTDHNPNVMVELGLRLGNAKPVSVVRARGTRSIFNVDLLRVEEYDRDLWPSNIERDVPRIAAHLRATWDSRSLDRSFVHVLGSAPAAGNRNGHV